MTLRALALLAASVLAGGLRPADTIHLTDGKSIQNVQVVSEGLKDVAYKEGKNDRTVPSDTVLEVEYEKKPAQIGEAERSLLEDDPEGAVDFLDAYVKSVLEKPNLIKEFKWAPAYAAWRAVEVRQSVADSEGVKGAAGRVIQDFPASRFVPLAYIAKARAELQSGQAPQAQKTLGEFTGFIASQTLAKRWEFECRLGLAKADDKLKPASKRSEYERVLSETASLPFLQAAAQVLIGESLLAEAAANQSGAKELRTKASDAYDKVLANDAASRASTAAAHTGRGECLFLLGADSDDKAMLQQAILHFLRVTTLYREQGSTVAESLFYAMRCFDLLPDPKRKAEMRRELLALYPNTSWAADAKKY